MQLKSKCLANLSQRSVQPLWVLVPKFNITKKKTFETEDILTTRQNKTNNKNTPSIRVEGVGLLSGRDTDWPENPGSILL